MTEIPLSDKPSPYKFHYFDKNPRYLIIAPQYEIASKLLGWILKLFNIWKNEKHNDSEDLVHELILSQEHKT